MKKPAKKVAKRKPLKHKAKAKRSNPIVDPFNINPEVFFDLAGFMHRIVDAVFGPYVNERYVYEPYVPPIAKEAQRKNALAWLSSIVKHPVADTPEAVEEAYKTAAKRLHPDVTGGSHEQFVKLQEAYSILKRSL